MHDIRGSDAGTEDITCLLQMLRLHCVNIPRDGCSKIFTAERPVLKCAADPVLYIIQSGIRPGFFQEQEELMDRHRVRTAVLVQFHQLVLYGWIHGTEHCQRQDPLSSKNSSSGGVEQNLRIPAQCECIYIEPSYKSLPFCDLYTAFDAERLPVSDNRDIRGSAAHVDYDRALLACHGESAHRTGGRAAQECLYRMEGGVIRGHDGGRCNQRT